MRFFSWSIVFFFKIWAHFADEVFNCLVVEASDGLITCIILFEGDDRFACVLTK
jgi:hypothetical protein